MRALSAVCSRQNTHNLTTPPSPGGTGALRGSERVSGRQPCELRKVFRGESRTAGSPAQIWEPLGRFLSPGGCEDGNGQEALWQTEERLAATGTARFAFTGGAGPSL